jgi:hypothetical protein
MLYQGGSGVTEGARFGALIGVFAIGSFVVLVCDTADMAKKKK